MKKRWWFLIFALLIIGVITYFTFFYYQSCEDEECFHAALKSCEKVDYVDDTEMAVWGYRIFGKSGEKCRIKVTLLKVKEGTVEIEKAVDKAMICEIPIGSSISPQRDVSKCHGLLKESLQDLIIQKLHKYILENLGEISEEL